ncbi:hypothetical protein [Lentzea sp. E54]|uniref:hypothetical protein n=1 Tax=Lentzea xerophila TaxID=3435883 RepID=UPI003DA5543A
MRRIDITVGALFIANLLTAGTVTPASAAADLLYITQNGQTITHTNPPTRAE